MLEPISIGGDSSIICCLSTATHFGLPPEEEAALKQINPELAKFAKMCVANIGLVSNGANRNQSLVEGLFPFTNYCAAVAQALTGTEILNGGLSGAECHQGQNTPLITSKSVVCPVFLLAAKRFTAQK